MKLLSIPHATFSLMTALVSPDWDRVLALSTESDPPLGLSGEPNQESVDHFNLRRGGGNPEIRYGSGKEHSTDDAGLDNPSNTNFRKLSEAYIFTSGTLRFAIYQWSSNRAIAESEYGPIESWNVSQVTDMSSLFAGKSTFNDDISGWDVSKVTNMRLMFHGARAFNQSIDGWNVSSVINMGYMFDGALAFNQNISAWDVSSVTRMEFMFENARAFNQDITGWDVSRVTNMASMFQQAHAFNQDIAGWDVSRVTDMNSMFEKALTFNQDISGWDVSRLTWMTRMFYKALIFNQTLCWPNLLSSTLGVYGAFHDSGGASLNACCNDLPYLGACSVEMIEFQNDTYVRGGSYGSNNYNSATVLHLKNSGVADYDRKVIFEFDLMGDPIIQSLTETALSNARFKILIFNDLDPSTGYDDLRADVITNTDLAEITWDTATVDESFSSQSPTGYVVGEYVEFAAKPFVDYAIANDLDRVLFVVYEAVAHNRNLMIYSSERTVGSPGGFLI